MIFLVYINNLPLFDGNIGQNLLSNDSTSIFTRKQLDEINKKTTNAHSKASFCCNKVLLNNDNIIFSLRPIYEHFNNNDSFKFRGVYLAPNCLGKAMLIIFVSKLRNRSFLLRNLVGCVSLETLKIAYHSLFHSIMCYGLIGWNGAQAERVSALQKIAIWLFKYLYILTVPSNYIYDNLLHIIRTENHYLIHGDLHSYDHAI